MVSKCSICGKDEEVIKGTVCHDCLLEKNRKRAQTLEAKEKRKAYEKRPERLARKNELKKDPLQIAARREAVRRYNQTAHGKKKNRERQIRMHQGWKNECFKAYGGPECMWCGDTYYKALSIDHIENDGADHRNSLRGTGKSVDGHSLYLWLRRNNFPPGYQVLCHTCNWVKHVNGGVLPLELKDRLRKNKDLPILLPNEESCLELIFCPIEKDHP